MTGLDPTAIIADLALAPHPEGGWYRETFRDAPAGGGRGALSQIYYLLREGECSRWHRVDAIEVWHFYSGEPLALHIAEGDGPVRTVVLGTAFADGQAAHAVVPANAWQAAEPLGAFTLVGCTVAPAFQFAGFELASHGWRPQDNARDAAPAEPAPDRSHYACRTACRACGLLLGACSTPLVGDRASHCCEGGEMFRAEESGAHCAAMYGGVSSERRDGPCHLRRGVLTSGGARRIDCARWRRRVLFAFLVIAAGTFLFLGRDAFAETVPQALRADIHVRKLLTTVATDSPPTRIAKDPRDATLYYLKRAGEIYQVDIAARTSTFVAGAGDHGLSNTQGMVIGPDGTIYLVGNSDVSGTKTQATIAKGVPGPTGRVWSVLARTAAYPKSKTAYDHRLNGIIVDQTGNFIYVNSGSRTDHGEVQSAGGIYPGVRDVGLTACILKLPTSGNNIFLRNDRMWLKSHGYIFAEGTRNTYDMAFAPDGNLFGTENGPDRDMSDELNWLRPGLNYGFPWRIGGADNPQQFPDYDPASDRLLNPLFNAVKKGYYRNDPTFPPRPATPLIEPVRNFGPHADSFRASDGTIRDASALRRSIGTFTAHRSPLGLVFDRAQALAPEFRGDGFMLSWTKGDPTGDTLAGPFKDPGQDLLHLKLTRMASDYSLHATRIVRNFNNPVDAEIIDNKIYVLDYGGTQSIWEITLPQ